MWPSASASWIQVESLKLHYVCNTNTPLQSVLYERGFSELCVPKNGIVRKPSGVGPDASSFFFPLSVYIKESISVFLGIGDKGRNLTKPASRIPRSKPSSSVHALHRSLDDM